MKNGASDDTRNSNNYPARHLQVGWWTLLLFTAFGLALEYLHAFKAPSYLSAGAESRRLLWTLAHAHGTLLAIVNILFGLTLKTQPGWLSSRQRWISSILIAATVLLPTGFFLGGVSFYEGDPGLGALLVPAAAVLLLAAILLIARSSGSK
jgi:hypothetical protein